VNFSNDINLALNDFGVLVSFKGTQGKGIIDMPDVVFGEVTQSTEYQLTIRTGDFSAMIFDDEITVDGIAYRVRSVFKLDDGIISRVLLSKE
jgi:hypothetical protein